MKRKRNENSSVCTLSLTKHRGVIESPNFPNKYPHNLQCEWTVSAPAGNRIYVAFSQFELEEFNEEYYSGYECFDYLKIEQKKSGSDEILDDGPKICGKMPAPFFSIADVVVFK